MCANPFIKVERGLLLYQIENTTHFLNQEAQWTTHKMRHRLHIAEHHESDRVEHMMRFTKELGEIHWAEIIAASSVYLSQRGTLSSF